MSGEDALKTELKEFKADVNSRFDSLHSDLTELTKAMRDLIKLDGYIQRVADQSNRIGKQVDLLEERVRELELANATNSKTVGRFDKLIDRTLSLVVITGLAYIGLGA